MFFVYILQCDDGHLYTGFTSRLDLRLAQHRAGEVKSTRRRLPITLIYYEAHRVQSDALRREKYFRNSTGRKAIKFMLKDYLRFRTFTP